MFTEKITDEVRAGKCKNKTKKRRKPSVVVRVQDYGEVQYQTCLWKEVSSSWPFNST